MNLNQVNQHLNIVAQVYTKCGMAVMDVHCLLLRWPLMCVKGWHLFLDLVGMCVQSYSESCLCDLRHFNQKGCNVKYRTDLS